MKKILTAAVSLTLVVLVGWSTQAAKIPAGAGVEFESPKDGETVGKTFEVKFKVVGPVQVKEANKKPEGKTDENTVYGHHHVIVDGEPVPQNTLVKTDQPEKFIHYGKGQTSAQITLPPGKHTLTLQFADYLHISYGPQMAKTIHITVKE